MTITALKNHIARKAKFKQIAFWYPPKNTALQNALTAIVGILLQHKNSCFILLLPIFLCATLIFHKSKRLIFSSILLFLFGFLYEYQKQNHLYAMLNIKEASSLTIKITDSQNVNHSQLYKQEITGSILGDHYFSHLFPWKVKLYSKGYIDLTPGYTISISKFRSPSFKDDNFRAYLCKENIAATIFLSGKEKIKILSKPIYSLTHFFWKKQNNISSTIRKICDPLVYALNSCIFWGNRNVIKSSPHVKELFKNAGISHHLARSGLHLIIFLFLWQLAMKALFISQRKKTAITVLISFFYFLLSWPSISFIRAFLFFLFFCTASFFRRRATGLHVLCLTCICILIYNPIQIFFLDFQLSFGLTLALVWHNHIDHELKNLSLEKSLL